MRKIKKYSHLKFSEKKNRVNREETASHSPQPSPDKVPNQAPIIPPKQQIENNDDGNVPSWRRPGSLRTRGVDNESANSIPNSKFSKQLYYFENIASFSYFDFNYLKKFQFTLLNNVIFAEIEENEKVAKSPLSPNKVPEEPEVVLRRTHSFETDEKYVLKLIWCFCSF